MQAVDLQGDYGDVFNDDDRLIPNAHLHGVCKFKCGRETCRYISLVPKGYICVKKCNGIKNFLDDRCKNNQLLAQGDNCEGLGDYK